MQLFHTESDDELSKDVCDDITTEQTSKAAGLSPQAELDPASPATSHLPESPQSASQPKEKGAQKKKAAEKKKKTKEKKIKSLQANSPEGFITLRKTRTVAQIASLFKLPPHVYLEYLRDTPGAEGTWMEELTKTSSKVYATKK